MANSRFEYVREFEVHDTLLPQTYIVVRIDGKSFHQFSKYYEFDKPNDEAALKLMNSCAKNVVLKYSSDIIMAFGESDEYSFILKKECVLYQRRKDKLSTLFATLFTANYVALWPKFFPDKSLHYKHLPCFDARCISYPNLQTIKDYLCWRFVDTHINNLYNTAFWNLVIKCGLTTQQAEQKLCGTLSSDKHEILFSECGVNYNNEQEMFKKGSLITSKGEILHVDVVKKIDELFDGY
ncbi:HHR157Cp [Eremothecium sinecaudum]|uniref:tRNA(His) guanylyltransferase n=1 Tax=Eremothecium sinecaudum TaxID=45286 RepID=A0A0X8HWS2_9SACH|nr:HHR157Cp [Eremothecium sinecaudum]AMD22926.1 HHR157Cp [Eremothecium sinecaudum]